MTIGHPDPKVSYPQRQALYPVPVRHNNSSPTASFRSPVTRDTLAFGYQIPVITALLGLGVSIPSPLRFTTCPAHLEFNASGIRNLKSVRSVAGHFFTEALPQWMVTRRAILSSSDYGQTLLILYIILFPPVPFSKIIESRPTIFVILYSPGKIDSGSVHGKNLCLIESSVKVSLKLSME